jgi:hypothetical protein
MLKSLIKFLAFILILCGIVYAGIHVFFDQLSYRAMAYAIETLQSPNLKLSELSYADAALSSLSDVTWTDFNITATKVSSGPSKETMKAKVSIKELKIETVGFFVGLFNVSAKGLNISIESSDAASSSDHDLPNGLQEGNLLIPLKLNVMNPGKAKAQLRNYVIEMKNLWEFGKTTVPINFKAEEILAMKGNSFAISLWVEQKDGNSRLVAKKEDIFFINETILPKTMTSTPVDIEIIANNPLKAPQLWQICLKSSNTAADAHRQNARIPEDAYRHVLWSFLLTKEYGADFATEVTNAHEMTMDAEEKNDPNAKASHQQDYANNETGRQYALQGYSESSILDRVMRDPKVIRDEMVRMSR